MGAQKATMAQPKPYVAPRWQLTGEERRPTEGMFRKARESRDAARREFGEVDVVALVRRDRDDR